VTALLGIIERLEAFIRTPEQGLPEDIFLFLSRNTPMINTDLLIRNSLRQTLLTWRDDGYDSPGWHVPGGIIRYKETIEERIRRTARNELGAEIEYGLIPLAVNELISPQLKNRGHFISMLFACTLIGPPDKELEYRGGAPHPGEWMWHDRCPENIISVHGRIYEKFINRVNMP
jgi:ADP-ribose pyrophosphatase YjhB (NUDIX family)